MPLGQGSGVGSPPSPSPCLSLSPTAGRSHGVCDFFFPLALSSPANIKPKNIAISSLHAEINKENPSEVLLSALKHLCFLNSLRFHCGSSSFHCSPRSLQGNVENSLRCCLGMGTLWNSASLMVACMHFNCASCTLCISTTIYQLPRAGIITWTSIYICLQQFFSSS